LFFCDSINESKKKKKKKKKRKKKKKKRKKKKNDPLDMAGMQGDSLWQSHRHEEGRDCICQCFACCGCKDTQIWCDDHCCECCLKKDASLAGTGAWSVLIPTAKVSATVTALLCLLYLCYMTAMSAVNDDSNKAE
jgi:hypothetical protein